MAQRVLFLAVLLASCVALATAQSVIPPNDPSSVTVANYTLDLDLPPQQRWVALCHEYRPQIRAVIASLIDTLPREFRLPALELANQIGMQVDKYLGEYGLEMVGVAKTTGIPLGDVVLANFIYELTAACTSIVAADVNGNMYHGRNLDFGSGGNFTQTLKEITINVDFQRNNKTVYFGTTYCGYVGLLTGMAPKRFSVSVDEMVGPYYHVIGNVLQGVLAQNASAISFLIRDALNDSTVYYQQAVPLFSTEPLLAPVYYILAGTTNGEGVVITRDRDHARDIWAVSSPQRWFEVETNYDHWTAPPASDDRVDPANAGMEAMGQNNLSLEGLYNVLSTKPVLNQLTTYTALMRAVTGEYYSAVRNCPAPCPM